MFCAAWLPKDSQTLSSIKRWIISVLCTSVESLYTVRYDVMLWWRAKLNDCSLYYLIFSIQYLLVTFFNINQQFTLKAFASLGHSGYGSFNAISNVLFSKVLIMLVYNPRTSVTTIHNDELEVQALIFSFLSYESPSNQSA